MTDRTTGTPDTTSGAPAPRPTPTVVGLDLSLSSTGIAVAGAATPWTERVRTPGLDGLARIRAIVGHIALAAQGCDLAVLEGAAYGSQARGRQQGHHERAGLWWMVLDALQRRDIPVAVVPPNIRAMYATGKGNAGKADVIREVTRRFPWFEGGEDEADAAALVALGRDHLGHPLAVLPATHRRALDSVAWPDLIASAS